MFILGCVDVIETELHTSKFGTKISRAVLDPGAILVCYIGTVTVLIILLLPIKEAARSGEQLIDANSVKAHEGGQQYC